MPHVESHRPGRPCWADVTAPDLDGAIGFYTELFGWDAATDPRPEAGGYTMFTVQGKAVAAASPPQAEGIPPHWTVYLATADVDRAAASVRDAGGTLLMEPFDVFDAGRMTVAVDPAGAAFGLWEARASIGSELRGEPGTMNWAEVQTSDRRVAQPFYERVFGYGSAERDMGGGSAYVVFELDGEPAAGLVEIGPDWGDVPSNWSVVLQVADTDAAVATVRERGGSVHVGPREIDGIGRFAVVGDPWGATFQVIA